MKIKHSEIEVDVQNPFVNCKLEREQYATVLTEMVKSFSDGFVLAIDNKWGTGKTTFIRMWEQQLKNEGFTTVNFNAWENDFEENVLIALISELGELKNNNKEAFKSVVEKAAPLITKIGSSLVKSLAKKYVGEGFIQELVKITSEVTSETLSKEIEEYTNRKQGIKDFKENLHTFAKSVSVDKPLIFIIDELDRCRPNYAVSVLETIKHLFSIDNIVFVLSIDKEQLGHAVRGVYGSEQIEADEYLRRFIDIEYSIPEPNEMVFSKYLYDYFEFSDFFNLNIRKSLRELGNEASDFLTISSMLVTKLGVTLRQQEKIFAQARISLKSFNDNEYVKPLSFFTLSLIKIYKRAFYDGIKNKSYSIDEFLDQLNELFPNTIEEEEIGTLSFLEADITALYCKYKYDTLNEIFTIQNNVQQMNVKSKLPEKGNNFKGYFKQIHFRGVGVMSIMNLIKRIDLTERFQT